MKENFLKGIRAGVPFAISFFASFMAVGVFLRQAGFDVTQTFAMTASVFASPAQFGVAQSYKISHAIVPILILVSIINARFFIMAASLVESFRSISLYKILLTIPLLSASTFAVTQLSQQDMAKDSQKKSEAFYFFLGAGSICYLAALLATFVGGVSHSHLPKLSEAWLTMILPLLFSVQMSLSTKNISRVIIFMLALIAGMMLKPKLGVHTTVVVSIVLGLAFVAFKHLRREKK